MTEIVITNSVPELSLTHDSLTAINEIGIGDIAVADTFLMILQPDKEDILNVYSLWRANLCATFLGNLVYLTPASKMLHFP